jgi:hypothetical protein
MAEKKLSLDLEIKKGTADESVKSIKKQLVEAKNEAYQLGKSFGEFSPEAIKARQKVGELTHEFTLLKKSFAAVNPSKFAEIGLVANSLARGFQAAQGAMTLFGKSGENVEKQILKLQAVMALADGLEGVKIAAHQMQTLAANVAGPVVAAFKKLGVAMRAAMAASGIGIVLVALGAIVAYWDDIKEAIGGVSAVQKKLNESSKENLKTQTDKLDAIGEQENILKLQGKSEKEILAIKIRQIDEAIHAAEIDLQRSIDLTKSQIEAEKRNKKILEGLLNFVSLPITAVVRGIDLIGKALGYNFKLWESFTSFTSGLLFDPEKTQKEADDTIKAAEAGILKLKNLRAGYVLDTKSINDKAAKDQLDADKEWADLTRDFFDEAWKELAETEKKEAEERLKAKEKAIEDDIALGKSQHEQVLSSIDLFYEEQKIKAQGNKEQLQAIEMAKQQAIINSTKEGSKEQIDALNNLAALKAGISEEDLKKEKAYQDAILNLKESAISAGFELLNALNQTNDDASEAQKKKSFERGKALAIASTVISTYMAAQLAYQSQMGITSLAGDISAPIRAAIAASVAVASGLAKVAVIKKQTYNGGGASGGNATGGGQQGGGGGFQAASTGFTSIAKPQTNITKTDKQDAKPIKVYVVQKDLDQAKERSDAINAKALVK